MLRSAFLKISNNFFDLRNTQIIILGNQKSGTTAIAKLLAENTGKSILLDTPLLWEPNLSEIFYGKISLEKIINKNKYYFSRQIIKEPNLTFLYDQLISIYPNSVKFIFIVRDPRDNIRSLLNRIKVPGNLQNIDSYTPQFTNHEKVLFNKDIIPYSSNHYIKQLAERWVKAVSVYLAAKENFTLVKYEDFNKSKLKFINDLSLKMGCELKNDISSKINIQYQPKGDRSVKWEDFFGLENLEQIIAICKESMQKIGYYI